MREPIFMWPAVLLALACGQGPAGPIGPKGEMGEQGPPGSAGVPADAGIRADSYISALLPDTIVVGRPTSVIVLGVNTNFTNNSILAAGGGVSVNNVEALSPTAIRGELTATSNATLGLRDITISGGGTSLTLVDGLKISAASSARITAGTLGQGGAFTLRIEISNGRTFSPAIAGTSITPAGVSLAGSGLEIAQLRWIGPTTVDAIALVSPVTSTRDPPVMTMTFDDGSAELIPLPLPIASTSPISLGSNLVSGTLGTLRGAVYSMDVTVVPTRLNVTTAPSGATAWTPRTRIFDSAGGLIGDGSNSVSSLAVTPGRYFVVVNNSSGEGDNQSFSIAAAQVQLSPNAVCAGSTPLVLGTPLTGETIMTGGAASRICLPAATGPARYYSIQLGAGESATVRVTPSGFDANIRVIDSCSMTTCQNSIDFSLSNFTSEVLTVRNVDPLNSRAYIVIVGSRASTTTGTFTLLATPQSYAVTTPAAACQDMTGATPVMGPGAALSAGDSVSTADSNLPFAFTYFGNPVFSYSVSSNGLLGLFASPLGPVSPTATLGLAAFPNAGSPNSVVAPYAADLDQAGGIVGTTVLSVLTVGIQPARTFVIEWYDFAPYGASPRPERLQFQVKLRETTNVIELHYCRLDEGAGIRSNVSGGNAVIGIENLAGSDSSIAWANHLADSVDVSHAIVFTPYP